MNGFELLAVGLMMLGWIVAGGLTVWALCMTDHFIKRLKDLESILSGAQRHNIEQFRWATDDYAALRAKASNFESKLLRLQGIVLGDPEGAFDYGGFGYSGKNILAKLSRLYDRTRVTLPVTWIRNGKKEKSGPQERNVDLNAAVSALYRKLGIELECRDDDARLDYRGVKPRRKR